MLQRHAVVRDQIAPVRWSYLPRAKDTDRESILHVLNRAAEDVHFIAQLTHDGARALQGYALSLKAQAALLSGDVRWIEARVGKLNHRLRTWLDCRLQQEIW